MGMTAIHFVGVTQLIQQLQILAIWPDPPTDVQTCPRSVAPCRYLKDAQSAGLCYEENSWQVAQIESVRARLGLKVSPV